MGRYFGICNSTRGQEVSNFDWKNTEWCCLYQVMHQMHWEITDFIYSASYDTYCYFKYNSDEHKMECIDHDFIWQLSDEGINEITDYRNIIEGCNEDEFYDRSYGYEKTLGSGYEGDPNDMGAKMFKKLNHIPKWNENKCECCGYVYDSSKLPEYEKKFDSVGFMN